MKQVIVIGPPRSGTSVIARLLQENLGIMMDEGPIRRDLLNPKGFYEDQKVIAINSIALKRWQIGANHAHKIDPLWACEFAKWVVYRTKKYKWWGFKEPRCVGFISWVKQFFPDAHWIVTDRRDELIEKSQIEKLGINPEFVKPGIAAYRQLIEKNLSDYIKIDMSEYQPENVLTKKLRALLCL